MGWSYERVGHLSRMEINELATAIAENKAKEMAADTLQKLPAFIGLANYNLRTKESAHAGKSIFENIQRELNKSNVYLF